MSDGTSGDFYAYWYDDFNRLVTNVQYPWANAGVNYAYAYDRYGNRWQQTLDGSCSALERSRALCVKCEQKAKVQAMSQRKARIGGLRQVHIE
jgi:hypothetical protein